MMQFARVLSLVSYYRSKKIPTALSQMLLQVKVFTILPGPVCRQAQRKSSLYVTLLMNTVHTPLDRSLDDFIFSARSKLSLVQEFSLFRDYRLLLMR